MPTTPSSDSFSEIAARHGLLIDGTPIADGRVHRVPTTDKPHSRNGAYLIDAIGHGWFQDHATMATPQPFRIGDAATIDPSIVRRLAEARREEIERRCADAAQRAQRSWQRCKPANPGHSYLATKRIAVHGARQIADRLVIAFAIDGAITSLQFIGPTGSKTFLRGGRKRGAYVALGDPPKTDGALIIAEGFATVASIREALGVATVASGDAGNLAPVALHLRKRFPNATIFLAADHDANGIGETRAREAARVVNGTVVMPPNFGDDWNDVACRDGLDAVRAAFASVIGGR